jgi:hypothetical protein
MVLEPPPLLQDKPQKPQQDKVVSETSMIENLNPNVPEFIPSNIIIENGVDHSLDAEEAIEVKETPVEIKRE